MLTLYFLYVFLPNLCNSSKLIAFHTPLGLKSIQKTGFTQIMNGEGYQNRFVLRTRFD